MRLTCRILLLVGLLAASVTAAEVALASSIISFGGVKRGVILIRTSERRLYLGIGNGQALSYPIGVGRAGRQWTGRRWISAKSIKPAWRPTPDIRRDKPNIASIIPGGSPQNPMGAAALLISGSGQYAIHGTNNPGSIGRYVSYGCIRMHNDDIIDLYRRVYVGTTVVVTN
jgi:lipoprotein-anchoring transpeptidase ErfK/SrfK